MLLNIGANCDDSVYVSGNTVLSVFRSAAALPANVLPPLSPARPEAHLQPSRRKAKIHIVGWLGRVWLTLTCWQLNNEHRERDRIQSIARNILEH